MKTKFLLLALLVISKIQFSQQLIINEVSQGPSGSKEYVELLVVGSPTCNSVPCMDLRNYIIDDNNGNHALGAGTGIAPGCVRLKNIAFWQCIPYGTLILLYNDADANGLVPATDLSMADGNCKLVIPISDCSLLERHTTLPVSGSPAYPSSGFINCGNWNQIAMSNSDDSFQTISPLGAMLHSVSWGNNTISPIIYFAGSATSKVAVMTNSTDNNPANQLNWIMAAAPANETPGSPNNVANAAWINSMNNSCLPILPLSGTVSASNATCTCNGSATISASGAIAPYTYTWSPSGGSSNVASGLCPGTTYTVSFTSSNGCIESLTVSISNASTLSAAISSTNVLCFGGSTGAASVTASGGTPGYSYTWSPSASSSSSITSLSPGSYTVLVQDASSCTVTAVVSITQPTAALSAAISSTSVLCFGAATGAASVTASGGTPGYSYTWSPSGGSASSASSLSLGSYTVLITDANNCTITAVASITQPTAALSAAISSTNVLCFGGSTGAASVTASGGTPGYSYTWSPSGGSASSASSLSIGSYTVLITDANNCTVTAVASITQPTAALSAAISSTNVLCFGGSTGTASVTASGGTPGYSYTWSPSGGSASSASSLSPSSYTVLVQDANSCTVTAVVSITQPTAALSAAISSTNVLCFGGSTGAASVTASGGTPGYSYTWSPSGGSLASASFLSPGSYTVLVQDANSCTVTAVVSITQPTAALSAAISSTNVLCFGGSTGAASVTASGGTPGYSYNWSPSGGSASSASSLSIGSYTVLIADANNCTVTAVVSITQPTAALSAAISSTNVLCFGAATGAASITPSGGTPGYSYTWSPSGGSSSSAMGLAAGNYTVLIKDANNCTVTAVVSIMQPTAALSAALSSTNVLCFGGSTGAASVTASGGTPGYSYIWNPSGGSASSASSLSIGSYTVLITDANNCTVTAVASITQPTAALSAAISSTNVLCFGGSTGTASVTASGGTPGYSYTWSPSGGSSSSASSLAPGSYTVLVQDANSCTLTAVVSITQPTAALSSAISSTSVLCFGAATGAASVTPSGGTPGYSYTWSPSGGTSSSATGLAAGNYTVLIKDANSCTITAVTSITQPTIGLSAIISSTNILCFGGSTGAASVTPSGGLSGYNFTWTPTGSNSQLITSLTVGNYTILIKDANNCTVTAVASITQPTAALSAVISATNVLCFGGSTGAASVTASGGTSGYTYIWSPSGGSSVLASFLSSNNYTVLIKDVNNCTVTAVTSITQPTAALSAVISATNVSCFGESTGAASVVVSQGIPSYSYTWIPSGGNSSSATSLNAGNYTVLIKDANGCKATAFASITQPAILSAEAITSNETCGMSNGSASLTVLGGTPKYSYAWKPFGGNSSIGSGFSEGNYTVTIKDSLGCVIKKVVSIIEPIEFQKPIADFIASDYNVVVLEPLVNFYNKSINAKNYHWDFMGKATSTQLNPFYNFSEAGKYQVTLIAYNGICSDTITQIIECKPVFTFYAPNVFTPDKNNLNDTFLPKGEGWKLDKYNLKIFDRWGEKLFETNQYDEGWNGMHKDSNVKNDVYVWVVSLTDIDDARHQFIGKVLVLIP